MAVHCCSQTPPGNARRDALLPDEAPSLEAEVPGVRSHAELGNERNLSIMHYNVTEKHVASDVHADLARVDRHRRPRTARAAGCIQSSCARSGPVGAVGSDGANDA